MMKRIFPALRLRTPALRCAIALSFLTLFSFTAIATPNTAPPAAPATTQVESLGRSATAPAAAASAPATTAANTVHLDEDPNMRIWGRFTPRQMLHLGITAIVVFNTIGWALLLWGIYRVKQEQRAKKAAAKSG